MHNKEKKMKKITPLFFILLAPIFPAAADVCDTNSSNTINGGNYYIVDNNNDPCPSGYKELGYIEDTCPSGYKEYGEITGHTYTGSDASGNFECSI
jgi:hypothetical protein